MTGLKRWLRGLKGLGRWEGQHRNIVLCMYIMIVSEFIDFCKEFLL